jgi:hypothetical protein
VAFGLRPVQLPHLDLRGQQRDGALLERRLHASQFVAGGGDRLLRLNALRLDLVAQRVERGPG